MLKLPHLEELEKNFFELRYFSDLQNLKITIFILFILCSYTFGAARQLGRIRGSPLNILKPCLTSHGYYSDTSGQHLVKHILPIMQEPAQILPFNGGFSNALLK